MKLHFYSISAPMLRILTPLSAKSNNSTRCSLTYQIVLRYVDIKEHMRQINHPYVKQLLLTKEEIQEVSELLRRLSVLQYFTIKLQPESTTLLDARNLFDDLIQKYHRISTRMSACSGIV